MRFKEIVHVRQRNVKIFDLTVFHCVIKNKHLPSLGSILFFFVNITFIPCVTCATQLHQPIAFDYFKHQPITDKWAERVVSAHARAGTIETMLVCGKFKFLRLGVF